MWRKRCSTAWLSDAREFLERIYQKALCLELAAFDWVFC